ncbi:hypothetical protein RN001_006335 [Aquatica leii]|uniref:Uncharacterized protein n=1 Tax=Aquatica leii TaxID=1421715 RepID=A0AAN7PIF1_9COLE|nr:hypothetical protein RN001_006335 [Aquatica leii]
MPDTNNYPAVMQDLPSLHDQRQDIVNVTPNLSSGNRAKIGNSAGQSPEKISVTSNSVDELFYDQDNAVNLHKAMEFVIVLLALLSKALLLKAEDCTTGFSVVAPELAVPGKTTAVLVTLHGPTSVRPLNVTLRLIQDSLNENAFQEPIETTQEIKDRNAADPQ